jgi:hypothetical protein
LASVLLYRLDRNKLFQLFPPRHENQPAVIGLVLFFFGLEIFNFPLAK